MMVMMVGLAWRAMLLQKGELRDGPAVVRMEDNETGAMGILRLRGSHRISRTLGIYRGDLQPHPQSHGSRLNWGRRQRGESAMDSACALPVLRATHNEPAEQ
jgi:hypothetical protein